MGQENKSLLSNQSQLLKMFTITNRVKDQNITYLQHLIDHKPFLLREYLKIATVSLSYNKNKRSLQSPISHQFSKQDQLYIGFQYSKDQGLCSKYYKIFSLWQFPRKTLSEENNQRALTKRPYTSQQIRQLLRQISQGLLALQKRTISHECLTSKSILVQQPMKFRVVDPISISLHTNPQLIYHNRKLKNIYLSPQHCQMIEQQDISKFLADPFKEDVFIAAMLVLESGLLQRQDDCYQEDCSKINWNQLEQNLRKFQERYGTELKNILALMLTKQASKRVDWQQLTKILERYNQPRLWQRPNSVQRVSIIPHQIERIQVPHLIPSNFPIINRRSYSPQAIQSSFVGVNRPLIQGIHPVHVIRHIPPKNSVKIQSQSIVKGKVVFNYQKGPKSVQTPSLPVENTFKVYQAQDQTTNPNTHPFPHIPVQPTSTTQTQSTEKTTIVSNNTPQTCPVSEKLQLKTNFPTIPEHKQQQQLTAFDLNQNQPIYVIQQFKNGSKFQGYKYMGKREGWGKYQYKDGGYYEGEWKNDVMFGKGKLYYQSGKIAYDGYLENDLFHGSGTLYNQISEACIQPFNYQNFQEIDDYWVKYNGEFKNDKKEGHGLLLLTNGQFFEGTFYDDKIQGQGLFQTIQGCQIRGIWHQNKLQRQL